MEINNIDFDSIFEGIDLPEDFAVKLKTAFDEAVNKKVREATKLGPVDTPPEAYAVGMSAAMKVTGDNPPLSKKTIRKAHKIAKGVMKSAGIKVEETIEELADVCEECGAEMEGTVCEACGWEAPMKEETEEIVRLESEGEMEDEEEMNEAELDPKELVMDTDMRKILAALKINPSKFAMSLQNAMKDVEGNMVADDAFNAMVEILSAIANDTNVASRLANALKDMTAQPAEEPTTEEETLEVYENVIESVDKYLTYVAESWIEENALAVEQGLKIEIMESFWNGLKTLYVENNIVLPEEINVVEDLNTKIADLESTLSEEKQAFAEELSKQKAQYEEKINEEINRSIVYKNKAEESTKKAVFESVSKDLSLSQKERFAKLTESVTYESKKSYEEKLKDIVKNAFDSSKPKKKLTEESMIEVSEENTIISEDPIMNLYSQAISKNVKF
jgi:hypothetical protein